MLCCLLLLALLLGTVLPQPVHQRGSYSVPEDFSAPLELPQKHFGTVDGTVDDYGIKPKQPALRKGAAPQRPAELRAAHKSKRDGLDLLEYYEDGHL